MSPSDALLDFLKGWESLRLKAYLDAVQVPTIGYGRTAGVRMGDTCTAEQADKWLREEVDETWHAIDHGIHQTLAQHEMDACTALSFNIGVGAFLSSTLLSRLNNGDFGSAADQFLKWCKGGRPLRTIPGLAKRRAAERAMFLNADYRGRP